MNPLDLIGRNLLENNDLIIEHSPYSVDIIINKKVTKDVLFGYDEEPDGQQYENLDPKDGTRSKGIIKFNTDRQFLKKAGIFFEDEIPVIGYFKDSDELKKSDIITVETADFVHDNKDVIDVKFQIVNIRTLGFQQTGQKIYILAPVR